MFGKTHTRIKAAATSGQVLRIVDRRLAFRARVVGLLVSTIIALALAWTHAGAGLEKQLRNWRDDHRQHAASGQVAIVEIDAESLAAISRWPLPRRYYAQLLARLDEARPDAVAFDIDFSAASNAIDDDAFAQALARFSGTVVLPTFRQAVSGADTSIVENLPLKAFTDHAFLGSVNVHPDRDGVIRTYGFAERTGGIVRPSVSALLAGARGKLGQSFIIDQSIDPATIPRVSFVDVMTGRAPMHKLQGRKILVGATAIELGDRYPTPLFGIQPGVVVQAMAVETLLQKGSLTSGGAWPLLILAVLIGAAATYVRGTSRRRVILFAGFAGLSGIPMMGEILRWGSLDSVPAFALLAVFSALLALLKLLHVLARARLTDPESGLPNRTALALHLARNLQEHAVVAAQIANLPQIESLLPPDERHAFTTKLVDRLSLMQRSSDICAGGNGVFVWTCDAPPDTVAEGIDSLAQLFRQPINVGGRQFLATVTFGVSQTMSPPRKRISEATQAATRGAASSAIYTVYTEALERESDNAQTFLAELDQAMAEGQFWVAYQPKIDIPSRVIYGAEALIRWRHPARGALRPDQFIPVLEEAQRIDDLTLYVMDQVFRDLDLAREHGLAPAIAINVSAVLLTDPKFVERFKRRIAARPDLVDQFSIEVTESAALADEEASISALNELAELGISMSIDDYGTGQSTLTYLKRFPADEIKVDQSFIRNLTSSRSDQLLVRSTIELGEALGFSVLAEGIEDQATMDLLVEMGCRRGQGWLVGKPEPFGEFLGRLASAGRQAA